MAKIHSHINDTETPSIVKGLLQGFVYAYENQKSAVWISEVKNKDAEYHRKVLLKQGRCDFDKPTNGLSSEELICLYNYYYFAMHFQSSFWLFNHIWNSGFAVMFVINKNPIFIDIGCGTLASSIAFSQTIDRQINFNLFQEKPLLNHSAIQINKTFRLPDTRINFSDIELYLLPTISSSWANSSFTQLSQQGAKYIFIDISKKILENIYDFIAEYKTITVESNGSSSTVINTKYLWKTVFMTDGHFLDNSLFDTFHLFNGLINHREFKPLYFEKLDDYIEHFQSGWEDEPIKKPKRVLALLKNLPDSPIIINCSYLFASNSINIDEVVNYVNDIVTQHQENICLIYQNPDTEDLNKNWEEFKLKVLLKSIAKGVESIKFYGNSKVRFEVLFKSKFGELIEQENPKSEKEYAPESNDDLPF